MRGKLEAVIYAAEEPVTLLQLAALFGEEALAERAAMEAAKRGTPESEQAVPPGFSDTVEAASDETAEAVPEAAVPGRSGAEATNEADPAPDAAPDLALDLAPDLVLEAEKRSLRVRERARREAVRALLDELMAEYDREARGMEIREIAGGFRVATRPEYHDAVRGFAKSLKPPMKLTLQALETLAVIAYKQPVTAPEVSEIRGVDSGGVLGSLVSRKLVTTAGRKQVVGRPMLYRTTREFLLRFGLKDLNELPSMEEFEKMAGELAGMDEEPAESGVGRESAPGPDARNAGPAETPAADHGVGAGDGAGERPRLEPLAISVEVEEEGNIGVSVNRSGVPVDDATGSVPNGAFGVQGNEDRDG